MSVSNPSPIQIPDANWDIESAIRGFTVSIPTRPVDNDLAGIIVLAKAGSGETLAFPNDVFYKGAWSDLIFVNTDANNNLLVPNQAYTVKVAAYDEFGTDSLAFSNAKETVTLQVVEADIADEAVTNNKIPDDEITSAKISGLVADKITAGTITGSTLQTASSGTRFVVSTSDGEAHFYANRGDGTVESLCDIGLNYGYAGDNTVLVINGSSVNSTRFASSFSSKNTYMTSAILNTSNSGSALFLYSNGTTTFASQYKATLEILSTSNSLGLKCRGLSSFLAPMHESPFTDDAVVTIANSFGDEPSNWDPTHKALLVTQGTSHFGGTVYFKSYTVATLPSATIAGGMVYVSDESGGAIMAFSDGTNWRRVTDRAIVS